MADFGIENHSSVGAEEQALGEFATYYLLAGACFWSPGQQSMLIQW